MRNIPQEFISNFHKHNFCYCYHISLKNGIELFLTSASNDVLVSGVLYIANSGLSIKELSFNDSAQDHAILEGIFDELAICKTLDLTDAKIKISILSNSNLIHLITYSCVEYTKYDLHFVVTIKPESVKYNQNLLKTYTQTCRARFGDNKCKFDKNNVKFAYQIESIIDRSVKLSANPGKDNGYFTTGEAMLSNAQNVFSTEIISHIGKNITLRDSVPDSLKTVTQTIVLTAGCDKKLQTCAARFNNATNFRGEPFIPTEMPKVQGCPINLRIANAKNSF